MKLRQPLATLTTHPSIPAGPSYAFLSSAPPSHSKRPLGPPNNHQGRRKVSRTEKGQVVTCASPTEAEAADDGDGTTDASTSIASMTGSASGSTRVLTPRARDVLSRDELGVGISPARRLFADSAHSDASDMESRTKDKAAGPSISKMNTSDTPLRRSPRVLGRASNGDAGVGGVKPVQSPARRLFEDDFTADVIATPRSTTHGRLAPSPPLFDSISSPARSRNIHNHDISQTSDTAVLPMVLLEPDANGVQRSIHDPGFTILADSAGTSPTTTIATSSLTNTILETSTQSRAHSPIPSIPSTSSAPPTPTPQTPRTQRIAASSNDKENIPPPRLISTPSSTHSSSSHTKTPSKSKSTPTPTPTTFSPSSYKPTQTTLSTPGPSRSHNSHRPATQRDISDIDADVDVDTDHAEVEVEAYWTPKSILSNSSRTPGTRTSTGTGTSTSTVSSTREGRNGRSKLAKEIEASPGSEEELAEEQLDEEKKGRNGNGNGDEEDLTPGRKTTKMNASERAQGRRLLVVEVEGI